jgi:hypothetical protein
MDERKPGCLELALSADLLVSPPIDIPLPGGRVVKGVFRELTQQRKDWLRVEALGWVEERRKAVEDQIGGPIRDADTEWDQLRNNRWDLLMLHAALRDPANTDNEACSLVVLEARLDPQTRVYLSAKYFEWESGFDPSNVSAEEVEAFINDIKKNKAGPLACWQRYGSAVAWNSIFTLIDRLETSQIDASTDTYTSEE